MPQLSPLNWMILYMMFWWTVVSVAAVLWWYHTPSYKMVYAVKREHTKWFWW